jgi:protein-S-isoprenylcysteine O-methyltransferase Ste14
MKMKQDSPGVYIPPPLIYVLIFIAAIFIQKGVYIDDSLFRLKLTRGIGILFLIAAFFFLATSLAKFFKTRNTVILIKPASSLQTSGVYAISRNPMYVGLLFVYLGITCFIGNWWNIILLPLLIFIMQAYVIKSEEKYLERAFGDKFTEYKKRVRRWL